jgi:hypothetical protein
LRTVQSNLRSLEEKFLVRGRYIVGIAGDVNVLVELYPLLHDLYASFGLRISSNSTMVNFHDHPIQIIDNLTHAGDGTNFLVFQSAHLH